MWINLPGRLRRGDAMNIMLDGGGLNSLDDAVGSLSRLRGRVGVGVPDGNTAVDGAWDGLSDLTAVAQRAKAEAIPITMGFAKGSTHPATVV
jgi:hypothetical protein